MSTEIKVMPWSEIAKIQSEKTGQSVKDIDQIHNGTVSTIIDIIKEKTPEIYESKSTLALRMPGYQMLIRGVEADGNSVTEDCGAISITPSKSYIEATDHYFTTGKKTKTA